MIGLDDSSLLGRPEFLQGNIDDIFAENGFIVQKDGLVLMTHSRERCYPPGISN